MKNLLRHLLLILSLTVFCSGLGEKDEIFDNPVIHQVVQPFNKNRHDSNLKEGTFRLGLIVEGNTQQFQYKEKRKDGVTIGCYGHLNPFEKWETTYYISDRGYNVLQPDPTKEIRIWTKDNEEIFLQWNELFPPRKCGKLVILPVQPFSTRATTPRTTRIITTRAPLTFPPIVTRSTTPRPPPITRPPLVTRQPPNIPTRVPQTTPPNPTTPKKQTTVPSTIRPVPSTMILPPEIVTKVPKVPDINGGEEELSEPIKTTPAKLPPTPPSTRAPIITTPKPVTNAPFTAPTTPKLPLVTRPSTFAPTPRIPLSTNPPTSKLPPATIPPTQPTTPNIPLQTNSPTTKTLPPTNPTPKPLITKAPTPRSPPITTKPPPITTYRPILPPTKPTAETGTEIISDHNKPKCKGIQCLLLICDIIEKLKVKDRQYLSPLDGDHSQFEDIRSINLIESLLSNL